MVKFQVKIDEKTFKALRELSQEEFRDWRLEAGFLIREAIVNRGLLIADPPIEKAGQAINQGAQDGCR